MVYWKPENVGRWNILSKGRCSVHRKNLCPKCGIPLQGTTCPICGERLGGKEFIPLEKQRLFKKESAPAWTAGWSGGRAGGLHDGVVCSRKTAVGRKYVIHGRRIQPDGGFRTGAARFTAGRVNGSLPENQMKNRYLTRCPAPKDTGFAYTAIKQMQAIPP